MDDETYKAAYLELFNRITDACAKMEQARDDCVVMEVVPEYDPGKEKEEKQG